MKIFKETEIRNPLYITVIDNGVTLFVYDGYAEDADGRRYYPVVEEAGEGENDFVGWRT